jgi:hypothetical protein
MSKSRLISLLIALSLTGLALVAAPPAAQADFDCSQFNGGRCIYHWNANVGCCVTNAGNCV